MANVVQVASFSEIEAEFIKRVHSVVWCNVATLDSQNRPRSRILHPIWEGAIGWIGTLRHSPKAKHLAHSPYVSLAYIADVAKPVYIEGTAEWADDLAARQRVWDMFLAAPPPLGYDPAPIFGSVGEFGLLKVTPWRIEVTEFPVQTRVWRTDLA